VVSPVKTVTAVPVLVLGFRATQTNVSRLFGTNAGGTRGTRPLFGKPRYTKSSSTPFRNLKLHTAVTRFWRARTSFWKLETPIELRFVYREKSQINETTLAVYGRDNFRVRSDGIFKVTGRGAISNVTK